MHCLYGSGNLYLEMANGWIGSIGGVSTGRVCYQRGNPGLFIKNLAPKYATMREINVKNPVECGKTMDAFPRQSILSIYWYKLQRSNLCVKVPDTRLPVELFLLCTEHKAVPKTFKKTIHYAINEFYPYRSSSKHFFQILSCVTQTSLFCKYEK